MIRALSNPTMIDLTESPLKNRPRKRRRQEPINDAGVNIISILDSDDEEQQTGLMVPPAVAAAANFPTATTGVLPDSVRDDLSHNQKTEHFKDARRPEQHLRAEVNHLREQLRSIPMNCLEERKVCLEQIREFKSRMVQSRKLAAEDIYNRNNSAGRMGNDVDGVLTVDFHGLFLSEAIEKYKGVIVPVLPCQRRVSIITGRGKHSRRASKPGMKVKSSLRDGLLSYIRNTGSRVHVQIDPKNEGVLLLRCEDNLSTERKRKR